MIRWNMSLVIGKGPSSSPFTHRRFGDGGHESSLGGKGPSDGWGGGICLNCSKRTLVGSMRGTKNKV